MARIIGTPHAAVGDSGGECTTVATVPPVCERCRQFRRWLTRTVGWVSGSASRFTAIIGAILQEHDDVLASLCGFCAERSDKEIACECVWLQYVSMGMPQTVVKNTSDACLIANKEVNIPVACYIECLPDCIDCVTITAPDPAIPSCWNIECASLCKSCEVVALDPCNVPDHLDIVNRIVTTATELYAHRGTGPSILTALSLLFPGSVPQIVAVEFGQVIVTLGRPFTPVEREYLDTLVNQVPLGFGVKLVFATPC